ncbi:GNAT family N-acetyltransferase [uncultured Methylobacterium sp.]|uniref:GNAT family N-acetyltransferase n=1 Tax=uncultured Methylobacterium sp. TaxID=157278 RepID=UPI0035CAFF13
MILVTDGERVAHWVAARCDVGQFQAPYAAFGWADAEGHVLGGVVLNNWNGANVELSLAGRGAVTRQAFRDVARYVFGQLGCRRITMHTKARNLRLISQAERNGFAREGMRRAFFPDDDAVALVLLRDHCRW